MQGVAGGGAGESASAVLGTGRLLFRGCGELLVEALLNGGHLGDEIGFHLFALGAGEDAELAGIADDVGGQGEEATKHAHVLSERVNA